MSGTYLRLLWAAVAEKEIHTYNKGTDCGSLGGQGQLLLTKNNVLD